MSLNLPDHRNKESVESLLTTYSAMSEFGQMLRKALAKRSLTEMAAVENELICELQQASTIDNQIARMNAEHSVRMKYLIHFGITPDERHEYQRLLSESALHGGLSPKEAAALTHAQGRLADAQRNGSFVGSDEGSTTDLSMAV